MKLGRKPADSDAEDIGNAMRQAAGFGQRPAVVVLRPGERQEQGFGSLLQWAAKISHWLDSERGLEPGDTLGLASPAGWLPAAAALGAWWTGVTVTSGSGGGSRTAVVHEHARTPVGADHVGVVGDAFDGSPTDTAGNAGEPLTTLARLFPDQPPPARARPDAPALTGGEAGTTQRALLDQARGTADDAPVGLTADRPPHAWLPAVALRPLLTGRPTVVLDRVDRDAAAADGVAVWL